MPFPGPWSLFIKPWRDRSLEEVAEQVAAWGFDGVELPVRDGFWISPEEAPSKLSNAVSIFTRRGLRIYSVAGPVDDSLIGACGDSGIPMLRTMPNVAAGKKYLEAEAEWRLTYGDAVPALEKANVVLGVQHHAGDYATSACALLRILENLPAERVKAVYDPAHCALSGELPRHAIDILEGRIGMVNLKNAIWRMTSGPEAEEVVWDRYWTSGDQGLARWSLVAQELRKRDWSGPILHFAEYADKDSVDRLTLRDFAHMKKVFDHAYS